MSPIIVVDISLDKAETEAGEGEVSEDSEVSAMKEKYGRKSRIYVSTRTGANPTQIPS